MATNPALSSHTNDPNMASARVFIGNLPTEKVEKSMLYSIFKKYGEVTGVSVHKGFAFVQFTSEEEARDAVECEHAQEVCGSFIDCKIASEGRSNLGYGSNPTPNKPRSVPQTPRFSQPARPDSPPFRFCQDYQSPGGYTKPPYSESLPPDGTAPRSTALPPSMSPFAPRESPTSKYHAEIAREKPFDCLVVSADKALSEYVDYITGCLKSSAALSCYVITYPASATNNVAGPHIPGSSVNTLETKRLIEDSARLGCCPITLGPITFTNSLQRSLTVNIHFGSILEEHRNMPLQDALHLIVNSFVQFTQQQRAQHISPSALVSYPVSALSQFRKKTRKRRQHDDSKSASERGRRMSGGYDWDSNRGLEHLSSDSEKRNSSSDDLAPPTCKRPARLNEVISLILLSIEKTAAIPEISLEEIDECLDILHRTRNKLSLSFNGSAHQPPMPIASHPQLVNLVTALPTSSTDLSVAASVPQSSNTCAMNPSNPTYVSGTAVLNATGATLTYVATPATFVQHPNSDQHIETPVRSVVSSAAFIHPQTSAALIAPGTPCFIHDSTTTLQYHHPTHSSQLHTAHAVNGHTHNTAAISQNS